MIVCCAIAFGSFGCSGQNIEGAWIGPLPFEDANACHIKVYSDHRFDVACGKLEWAGAGHYVREGSQLTLKFSALVHRGQPQRRMPELHLSFVGEGNTLRIGDVSDVRKPFVWRRASL